MKQCSVCKEFKDESDFFVHRKNRDGSITLRSECKACHSAREMDRYWKKQAFIDERKTPCKKCGEMRTRCISFHHINPEDKEFTVGKLLKSELDAIEAEINKCVCLCLNCHHEFHYLQAKNGISLDEYLGGIDVAGSYKSEYNGL